MPAPIFETANTSQPGSYFDEVRFKSPGRSWTATPPKVVGAIFVLVTMLLGGCASNLPLEIRNAPPHSPTIAEAHAGKLNSTAQKVRWGGSIVGVENRANDSWIEIVGKELEYYGRPRETDISEGRFLARVDGFIDPSIYSKDRELTIYGVLESPVEGKIGDRSYTYPVVKVEKLYLWPEYGPYPYSPYPRFYDPFFEPYDPFYPYYWRYWPYR